MIKLKNILKEIEGEKTIRSSWKTLVGTPDEVIHVNHKIIQIIMHKMGSGNDSLLAHYIKTYKMDEGTWIIWNPTNGMMLRYTKRGNIWELLMSGDAVGRQLNETDLENAIANWMR